MELFVVNRHEGDENEIEEHDEQSNLDTVLKKIERNKRIRSKQREREKLRQAQKLKTFKDRQLKRDRKAKFIPVPDNENDEFIDKNITAEVPEDKIENQVTTSENKKRKRKLDVAEIEGFTILGAESFDKKPKVKRVLPKWLSNPTVISVNLQNLKTKVSSIKELDKTIRKKLKSNGIKYFFPVQAEVIPWLLNSNRHSDVMIPRDICVSAPTGSGKTLAFALPVIQALKRHTIKRIRALIILPTQNLAVQVFKTFRTYAQNTNIDICLITGNTSFINEQKQLIVENEAFGYVSKVDILVCTAGRLVDHLKLTKGFNLQYLEFLVIDEADRVLDNIQNDWLYHLEKHISQKDSSHQSAKVLNLFTLQQHRPPQKLLFSATLSQDPEKLEKLSLFQPKLFTSVIENGESVENDNNENETFIGKYTTPRELSEKYIVCSMDLKPLVLYKFIKKEKLTKTLIFTHSIESAHRLMILLKSMFKEKLRIEEISSNLQAKNRNALINKFSNGDVDLLICTDSLTRGIDLPGVKCVISYSAPKYLKTYIHRAGRTARAGEYGLAITLLHQQQLSKFKDLLEQSGKTNVEELIISEDDLQSLGDKYKRALDDLKKTVVVEQQVSLKKIKSAKGLRKFKAKRTKNVTNNE